MHYTPSTIPTEAAAALAPAFDRYGLQSADEWIQRCRDDLAQLWNVGDVWAITEVCKQQDGPGIHIVAMAGDFTHEIMDEIEAFGRKVGCKHSYFSGRKGWLRRLPSYRLASITCVKEL